MQTENSIYTIYNIYRIFFVRSIPKVSQIGVVLRTGSWCFAHLKFYHTSAGKSTFRSKTTPTRLNFASMMDKKISVYSNQNSVGLINEFGCYKVESFFSLLRNLFYAIKDGMFGYDWVISNKYFSWFEPILAEDAERPALPTFNILSFNSGKSVSYWEFLVAKIWNFRKNITCAEFFYFLP